jgi:hypothetical protein
MWDWMLALLLSAAMADYASTELIIRMPGFYESNSIMANRWAAPAIKFSVPVGFNYGFSELPFRLDSTTDFPSSRNETLCRGGQG